jgi:hypothetical protein
MTKEEIVNGAMKRLILRASTKEVIEGAMYEYAKAWRERCLAAEDYIAKSPGDPDITEAQVKSYEKWQRLVEADPDAKDERSEYAKQQAIVFGEFISLNGWHVYGLANQWINGKDEIIHSSELYDQFIESQNKQHGTEG